MRQRECVCVSVCFLVPRAIRRHTTNFLFDIWEKNVLNIGGNKGNLATFDVISSYNLVVFSLTMVNCYLLLSYQNIPRDRLHTRM